MIPKFPDGASRADVLIAMARHHGWRRGAEIGVLDGRTSNAVLVHVKHLHLTGVDLWVTDAGKEHYPKQDRNERKARLVYEMHGARARLIKADSAEAAAEIEDGSLDFVFIDGDHTETAVRRDIAAWWPKVRRGGWMMGHDASEPGVRPAIDDMCTGWAQMPDDVWGVRVFDQAAPAVEIGKGGKVAIVLGGAACVWDDLAEATELLGREPDAVVACNDIGAEIPDLTAWVSVHANKFPRWKAKRTKNGYDPVPTWTHDGGEKADNYTDWALPGQKSAGSSGLFAAKVALVDLACDKAILCGIPMDDQPHFNDDTPWDAAYAHWSAFEELTAETKARIRSMSGRTRDLFGAPDRGWL